MTSKEAFKKMREVITEYHHTYISKEYPALSIYGYPLDNIERDLDKLGQLEDIEEELGIDLLTLFKALKNGIWIKNREDNIIRHLCTKLGYQVCGSLSLGGIAFEDTYYNEYYYSYEDYGKTWALTKEELENEK